MDLNEFMKFMLGAAFLVGVIAIYVCITYLWLALCLMFIAFKTRTPNSWLAWIPLANIFLMAGIAKIHWAWPVLLCVFLITTGTVTSLGTGFTILSSIASALLLVVIWIRICLACNRSGWWIILLPFPIINWIALGILAFSKK